MREWIKALPLGLGLPVMIGAASIKPEDAASNIAAWLHLIGIEHVPTWLSAPGIDNRVILGSLSIGVVYAFLVWGIPALRHKALPKSEIEDRWTWSALTAAEIDSLYEKLWGKGQHSIHVACSRAECSKLASSFDQLFKRLGWPSFVGDGQFFATWVAGILLNPEDQGSQLLKRAIETTTVLRPELGPPRPAGVTDPIMLVIGTKPEVMAPGPLATSRELEKTPNATVVRSAFSQTQSIKVLPSFLGGNDVLTLDNLATLKRHVPYSLNQITMLLDVVPVVNPPHSAVGIQVYSVQIYGHSKGRQFSFDTADNKRHEITVAGRTFIVTLLNVKKLDVPSVANPIEYVFGISEK